MAFDMNMMIRSSKPGATKAVVYADPGVGKTTFAATAKAALIDCENGAGGVLKDGDGKVWDICRTPYLESWLDIKSAIQAFLALDADQLPPAIAFDTGDWLVRRIVQYVCIDLDNKKPGDVTNTLGGAHGSFFKAREIVCNILSRELFPMLNLLNQRGCAIIILAHAENAKITTPEGHEVKMAAPSFVDKEARTLFLEWADMILYAKKEQGTGRRIVVTEGDNLTIAKNRYSLPSVLPLAWDAIKAAMTTNTQKEG